VKILVDTDVLLDVALGRPAFRDDSGGVLSWAEAAPGRAAVAWNSLSNLAYLLRPGARPFIRDLLTFVDVAQVGTQAMRSALALSMTDLEDAMKAMSALAFGADRLVTRNVRDFRNSPVPAVTPKAFLGTMRAQ